MCLSGKHFSNRATLPISKSESSQNHGLPLGFLYSSVGLCCPSDLRKAFLCWLRGLSVTMANRGPANCQARHTLVALNPLSTQLLGLVWCGPWNFSHLLACSSFILFSPTDLHSFIFPFFSFTLATPPPPPPVFQQTCRLAQLALGVLYSLLGFLLG